jgi:glycosyltransferase involved in cell wall biosynthesis
MDGPGATVLIATRNRAEHIAASLTTVLESARDAPFPVEVVVVDDGSTDHTGAILDGFAHAWPMLRVLHDPLPGKSGTLNRALGQVVGTAVCSPTADVHVPRSW